MRASCKLTLLLFAVVALTPSVAWSQAWPTKPIRIIVTFPPGGSSDVVARVIAPLLGEKIGQAVVVENKAGGGATIGAAEAARAAPDGYTFMLSNDQVRDRHTAAERAISEIGQAAAARRHIDQTGEHGA